MVCRTTEFLRSVKPLGCDSTTTLDLAVEKHVYTFARSMGSNERFNFLDIEVIKGSASSPFYNICGILDFRIIANYSCVTSFGGMHNDKSLELKRRKRCCRSVMEMAWL